MADKGKKVAIDVDTISDLGIGAFVKWGEASQMGMCVEEIGEAVEAMGKVLAAMNQFDRGRISEEAMIEEFVDVYVMMCEMRGIYRERFDAILAEKVERLRQRLEK